MRLIDADTLKERMGDEHFQNYGNAIALVIEAPTVDAVPVVRCRECKYSMFIRSCSPMANKIQSLIGEIEDMNDPIVTRAHIDKALKQIKGAEK